MLSFVDMGVVGVVALLVFGPDQLPKVARRAGQIMRDVQNTSQSFIREMERAADDQDVAALATHTPSTETVTHSDINPYADPVAETPARAEITSYADAALYSSTPTGFEATGIVPDAIVSADGPLTAAPAYHATPAVDVAPPKYVPPPSLAPRIAHFPPETPASETGEPAP